MRHLAYITFINPQTGADIDNSLPGQPAFPSQGLPGGGPVDPGFGQRPPVDPGYGRPGGGGRPDNSLPWVPPPGHVATLPVFPFDPTTPDNELPGSQPGPDNSLPPVQIKPGAKFVVKWLACVGLVLVPDNSLPGQGGRPDQSLPGSQPKPDNTLPGSGAQPDNTLPPTAQPKTKLPL